MKRAILDAWKEGEEQPAKRSKAIPSRNNTHLSKNTGGATWNKTEYSVFEPWRDETFELFCRSSGFSGDYHTPGNFKKYKSMVRRLIAKNDTTPGSVALSELMLQSEKKEYQKYLHNFLPEWDTTIAENGIDPRETSFISGMYQTALCSTKFMLSILEHWTDWCKKHQLPRCRKSFYLFATTMEADNRITSGVFHHTYTFIYAFSHLFKPDKGLPFSTPSTASEEPAPPDHEDVDCQGPQVQESCENDDIPSPFETTPPLVSEAELNGAFESEPVLFDPRDNVDTDSSIFTDDEIKDILFEDEI